jgi:DNA-binding FadR family transcriptional regulator
MNERQAVALPEELADMLLESIVDGQFPIESVLPSEGDLALKYGMSRLTVREAVRILRAQNIVIASVVARPFITLRRLGRRWLPSCASRNADRPRGEYRDA